MALCTESGKPRSVNSGNLTSVMTISIDTIVLLHYFSKVVFKIFHIYFNKITMFINSFLYIPDCFSNVNKNITTIYCMIGINGIYSFPWIFLNFIVINFLPPYVVYFYFFHNDPP